MSSLSGADEAELERRRQAAKAAREWAKQAHPFDRSRPRPVDQEVFDDETDCDAVLVAFPGDADRLGIPAIDFFEPLQDWDLRRVYIRKLAPMVAYPHALGTSVEQITASLRSIVADHRRVVFLGTSIGGLHALLFGTLVGVDTVIGLFPITSVVRGVLDEADDTRWDATLARTPEAWIEQFGDLPRLWQEHAPPQVVVHYPSGNRQYAVQAQHIATCANVRLVARHEHDTRQALSDDPRIYADLAEALWPGREPPRRGLRSST